MADDGVTIRITGNADDFKKAADEVKKLFGGISDSAKKESKTSDMAWASFVGNFASQAVTAGIGAVKDAVGAVFDKFKDGLSDALEADQAFQRFNVALANTGKFSKASSDGFSDFAESLEKTTGIASEATLRSGALIQSLGNLSSDGLQRATKASADLSAALGIDFETAANLLGKASTGNVEALKKYGLQVEDTGNKAKDFESALGQIESRFGGSAAASVDNFAGALKIASNSFDDLFKGLGQTITDTPALKGLAQGFGDIFQNLGDVIKENEDAIKGFVTDGVQLLIKGLQFAGDAVGFFFESLSAGNLVFTIVQNGVSVLIQGIAGFAEFLLGIGSGIAKFAGISTDGLDTIRDSLNDLQKGSEIYREENLNDALAFKEANDLRKQSVADFTAASTEAIQTRVAESMAAGDQEVTAELERRNVLAMDATARKEAEIAEIAAYQQTVLANAQGVLDSQVIAEAQSSSQKLINEGKYVEARKQLAKVAEMTQKESIFAVQKYDELTQKEKLANLKSTLGSIATLQSSGSQELFAIGKAAAVATATIDGIAAVQKALASAPPPFNFALAAVVGVATAANIAKIGSSQPPTGMAQGGLVTGGIAGVDSVPLLAQQGEIVAPARSFDEVVEGTARARGFSRGDEQAPVIDAINQLGERIGGGGVTLQVGTLIGDDNGINILTEKIRDAVQFRGAKIA